MQPVDEEKEDNETSLECSDGTCTLTESTDVDEPAKTTEVSKVTEASPESSHQKTLREVRNQT